MSKDLDYEDDLDEELDNDVLDDPAYDDQSLDEPYTELTDDVSYDDAEYESDDLYGDTGNSYTSRIKQTLAKEKYQNALGTAVGGAAGGAMLTGTPEAALLAGGVMGTSYLIGAESKEVYNNIKNYLSGNKDEENEE